MIYAHLKYNRPRANQQVSNDPMLRPKLIKKITSSAMNNTPINRNLSRIMLFLFMIMMSTFTMHAQEILTVSGIVVSPENKALANVSVSVEGSTEMPAFTNENGEFTVKADHGDVWIIAAPASAYKRKRIFLDGRSSLTIMLTPLKVASGEDQLVALSQQVQMKNMATAFSDLDLNKIHHSITTSIDQYMQGRVSGMHVVNRSGEPGSGAVNYIRGINSIHANTQPLYIVDGIIMEPQGLFGSVIDGYAYNPLLAINPLDISNATVVKDAVYASAYGSNGSNGLVMIQTLDPSATETSFEIDMRRGLSLKPERNIPVMNASQHKTLAKELLYSSGMLEEVMREQYSNLYLEADDERYNNYLHDTEWQQYIFENASFTNFNIKVKGGDEIARYGLSFGYYDNKGIIRNTSYQGYNLRFVSLVNIYTWLRMNASVSFNTSNSALKESARVKETSPILSALAKSPLLNRYQYDADGLETSMLSEVDEFGVSNPLATIENFSARSQNYHIITSLGFEADLGENLLLRTNFGIFYNALKENMFMPNKGMELYYDKEAHNVAKASTNTFNGFSNHSMLIYNKKFNANHSLNSTTGVNLTSNRFQYDWGIAKNAHENDEYRELANGIDNLREIGGNNRNWNWISIYEKLSYAYQDKYLASASVSLDGSSRIGKEAPTALKLMGQPFGLFYSAGLGWRVSNESFLNDKAWLEELKFRVAVGVTGNDDIGESNATNFYRTLQYRQTTGVVPGTIANKQLNYEMVSQLNAGIDLALWGNRVRMNFDLFSSTTNNLLIYAPLEAFYGFDYRPENSGAMKNTGWDGYLFGRLVNSPSFKWDIEATLSHAQNQITAMPNDIQITSYGSYELVNMTGEAMNSFYGYRFLGVYSSEEEAANAGMVNNKGIAYKAGDAIYEDISGPDGTPDQVINRYDKISLGSPIPEFTGGLSNTFSYKNWSLNAFVYFVTGNEVFNYLRYKNESMTSLANQSTSVLKRWQYDGQVTEVPRALLNDPVGNSAFSSRWIEDGSYLRLKNVSISYKIPNEFWAFKNAEFYISASNLLTLSTYLGYDPEFSYSFNTSEQGIDFGTTPAPRQFLVGIKIGL